MGLLIRFPKPKRVFDSSKLSRIKRYLGAKTQRYYNQLMVLARIMYVYENKESVKLCTVDNFNSCNTLNN